MSEPIKTKRMIVVPEALEATFRQLVADYALAHGETPENSRRVVELAILQKGLATLKLDADKRFGLRMGWNEEEETET